MIFFSCPCRQLTIRETAGDAGGRENSEAGYVHRLEFLKTEGIMRPIKDVIPLPYSWFGRLKLSFNATIQFYESRIYLYR